MRNRTLVRSLRLISALTHYTGGVSLDWLASHLGASARTIRRDLHALEEAHLPIESTGADGPYRATYRLVPGAPCPCCARSTSQDATC